MTARPAIADFEAERAVLGSILIDSKAINVALSEVNARDFVDANCRAAFEAMVALARAGSPIDTASVAGSLAIRGQLDRVGGPAGVAAFTEAVSNASNTAHHARRVHDRARLRRWVERSSELHRDALTASDPAEFLARAQSELIALTEEVRSDVVSASEWAPRALKDLERRAEEDTPPCVESGLQGLDAAMALRRGSLVVLAARPAMGKSCLAQNIAAHVAERGGYVLFCSLEMREEELAHRFVARRASINTRELARPRALLGDSSAWSRVYTSLRDMSELGIDLWCAPRVTMEDIRVRVLRQNALRPLDLVVVDYIQLMSPAERGENRAQAIGEITRGLKNLAQEINAPVLALSQLNRDVEKREPPIPIPADLRDSGSIEQDADFIAFIYRPVVYDEGADPEEAQLIFSKNRALTIGRYRLRFIAKYQKFED